MVDDFDPTEEPDSFVLLLLYVKVDYLVALDLLLEPCGAGGERFGWEAVTESKYLSWLNAVVERFDDVEIRCIF